MITRDIVDTLYKKYKKPPKSVDLLNMAMLFDYTSQHHNIFVDPVTEELTIGSIDPSSPFHRLPVSRINALVPFEEWVAVVMPSSIVFLNRREPKVAVDIKPLAPSFFDKLRGIK